MITLQIQAKAANPKTVEALEEYLEQIGLEIISFKSQKEGSKVNFQKIKALQEELQIELHPDLKKLETPELVDKILLEDALK